MKTQATRVQSGRSLASDHKADDAVHGNQVVIVLNQFALPRTQAGGTRHIDLFGRLRAWKPIIIAGSLNYATKEPFTTEDERFHLVKSLKYDENGPRRVIGWIEYFCRATTVGLRTPHIDLVYASSPQLLTLIAGLLVAAIKKAPFVVEIRDLWPESLVSAGLLERGSKIHRVLSHIERSSLQRADEIVVVTKGWDHHFLELGIDLKRVTVIPNGCEPEDLVNTSDCREHPSEGTSRTPTAVFAGSHGPKDGIHLILDAAKVLPHIKFLLIGEGTEKPAQQTRARRENLKNVEFRPAIPKSELARVLRTCDVGIHAVTPLPVFEYGMSPNKLFDYLACGLPIVSNAQLALTDVMADDQCGSLGGPDDLAGCIEKVLSASSNKRQELVANGLQLINDRFSRTVQARRLEKVLDVASSRYAKARS